MRLPGVFFFLSDPEMRLPGVIFLLAEVTLEFSPNCFQFLLAVLPHPSGTEQKKNQPTQLSFRAFL